jgi:hypothetical protein
MSSDNLKELKRAVIAGLMSEEGSIYNVVLFIHGLYDYIGKSDDSKNEDEF